MRATKRSRNGQQATPTFVRRRRRVAPILAVLSITTLVAIGLTPSANSAQIPVLDKVEKTSDPVTGSSVTPGQVITYTIKFTRGNIPEEGTHVRDDLGEVLNNASLVGSWPAGTSLEPATDDFPPRLIWDVSDLEFGESASISFQVRVNDNANGKLIRNLVFAYDSNCAPLEYRLAAESPGPDEPNPCETNHPVIAVAPPVVTVPAPAKPPVVRVPRSLPHTGA